LKPPFPEGSELATFGLGCSWGAEKMFWRLPGVTSTAVGYAGGSTPNPTYREVCSGLTGHTEVVQVVFDPKRVSYGELLRAFWEGHDPTQGMRQGNDTGTQYRSAIYTYSDAQAGAAAGSRAGYQAGLRRPAAAPSTRIRTRRRVRRPYPVRATRRGSPPRDSVRSRRSCVPRRSSGTPRT